VNSGHMHTCLITSEPILSRTVEDFLTVLKHDVAHFQNVDEAVRDQSALDAPYGVILVEMTASDDAVSSILSRLHERHPNTPVVVMLTNGTTLTSEAAVAYGVQAYLRKPISLRELELILLRLPNGGRKETDES